MTRAPLPTLRNGVRGVHRADEQQQPDWVHESAEECAFEKRAHEDQAWDDELDGAKRYEGDRW